MEGSRFGAGFVQINYGYKWNPEGPKTYGSYGMQMRIRNILRIQTRIRNTAFNMQEILRGYVRLDQTFSLL
jgi:hypothetical protein